MTVSGEITTYLAALGRPVDDPLVLAAFALAQPAEPDPEYRQGGAVYQHHTAKQAGVSYKCKDGVVLRIAIYLEPHVGGYAAYSAPDAIIVGLTRGSTRDEVRRVLGTPIKELATNDQFAVGDRKVAMTFRRDALESIVPMIAPN